MTDIMYQNLTTPSAGYLLGLARDLEIDHLSCMTPCALRNIASLAAINLPLLDIVFELGYQEISAPQCDATIASLIAAGYLVEDGNAGLVITPAGTVHIETYFQLLLADPFYITTSELLSYRTSGFEGPYGTRLLAVAAKASDICRDRPERTQDYLIGLYPDIDDRQWRVVFDALAYAPDPD
jgi:hypothetical protein